MSVKSKKKYLKLLQIIVIVVTLFVVAIAVWRFSINESTVSESPTKSSENKRVAFDMKKCEEKSDKDFCRFLENWQNKQSYRITTTQSDGDSYIHTVDGNKVHTKLTGKTPYEAITVDAATTYTLVGGTWYKYVLNIPKGSNTVGTQAPADIEGSFVKLDDVAKYKPIGKEACGDLICFKYESSGSEPKETLWFDNKEFMLRRAVAESNGSSAEAKVEYSGVTVTIPASSKELAKDEYLPPGATAPVKMPSAAMQQ